MPTYEYRCKSCKKEFELFQKISDPPHAKCPKCGADAKRLISAAAFSLKGGGWYKDGYAKSQPAADVKSEGKKTEEKKTEEKKPKTFNH